MNLESLGLWMALVAYVLAGSAAIIGVFLGRRPGPVMLGLLSAALVLHALAIGLRWERVRHGPFVTMFEILSSNIWSLALCFALACWRWPAIRAAAAVVMPILFVMMGWLLLTNPADGHFPPTYRTVWLYVHVGLGKVFLGAVLVAVGIAGVILLRSLGITGRGLDSMPADDRLDDLAFRLMAIGLVFETLMLITGAIWAQDAWGRYWAWDPLETWALLTWLSLAFALHMRLAARVPPRVGAGLIVTVFAFAFLTFFGIPFVSTSPHKGAV